MRGFYGVGFTDAHSCRDCLTYGFSVGSVMLCDVMPACLGFGLVLRWMLCPMHSPKAMSAPKGIRAYGILIIPPAALPAAMGWGLQMPADALPACLGACLGFRWMLWGGVYRCLLMPCPIDMHKAMRAPF